MAGSEQEKRADFVLDDRLILELKEIRSEVGKKIDDFLKEKIEDFEFPVFPQYFNLDDLTAKVDPSGELERSLIQKARRTVRDRMKSAVAQIKETRKRTGCPFGIVIFINDSSPSLTIQLILKFLQNMYGENFERLPKFVLGAMLFSNAHVQIDEHGNENEIITFIIFDREAYAKSGCHNLVELILSRWKDKKAKLEYGGRARFDHIFPKKNLKLSEQSISNLEYRKNRTLENK